MIRCKTGKKRTVFLVVDDNGEILDSHTARWFRREGLWGVVDGNTNAVTVWAIDRDGAEDAARLAAELVDSCRRAQNAISNARRTVKMIAAKSGIELPFEPPPGSVLAACLSSIGKRAVRPFRYVDDSDRTA